MLIEYKYWQDAIKLLRYQILQKQRNRHFRTLSTQYYETIEKKYCLGDKLDEAYFKKRVNSGLFFGLEREFASHQYSIPKSYLGVRNYRFLTYPMRVLYYGVGLYLLQLSQEYFDEYYAHAKNISSHYGGNLKYQGDELQLKSDSIYYKSHYSRFRKSIRREVARPDHKVVIKIDIADFYDRLSVANLLLLLEKTTKPSTRNAFRFDATAIQRLVSFFELVSGGKSGIPQADNDIISGFIGHLYLSFADLEIEDILAQNGHYRAYKVNRYVDDMYIVIELTPDIDKWQAQSAIASTTALIADKLYFEFGLNLSNKTRVFWLDEETDQKSLVDSLKRVSPEDFKEDVDLTPEEIVVQILKYLNQINQLSPIQALSSYEESSTANEILKEVYEKPIIQLLAKPEHRNELVAVIDTFNFELVRKSALPITILIDLAGEAQFQKYIAFLNALPVLSTRDVHLIVMALAQRDFKDTILMEKLKSSSHMKIIISEFEEAAWHSNSPGYHQLPWAKVDQLCDKPHVIEQIQLRVLAERSGSYSVALNHLVNEFQAICEALDSGTAKNPRDYKVTQVIKYLQQRKVPNRLRLQIRNLFDRRNINPLSHAGTASVQSSIFAGVTRSEYENYKAIVSECLKIIL